MFLVFTIVSHSTTAQEEAVIKELEECTDMWLVSVGDEQFFVLCEICGIIDARLGTPGLKIFVGGKKEPHLHRYSTTEHNMMICGYSPRLPKEKLTPVKLHNFDIVLGFTTELLAVSELAPLRVTFNI